MQVTCYFLPQHSPIGAHSSLTIGMSVAAGGMASERGSSADSGVFVGYKSAPGCLHTMPFMRGLITVWRATAKPVLMEGVSSALIFDDEVIERDYRWGKDTFRGPAFYIKKG